MVHIKIQFTFKNESSTNRLYDYLFSENIEELFKEASCKRISIINLERNEPGTICKSTRKVIIDFDLCSLT